MKVKYSEIYSLKLILLALVFSSMLSGCAQHYSVYGFSTGKKTFSWGSISARLIGSRNSYYVKVYVGSPYRLAVWFESEHPKDWLVEVTGFKLFDAETNKLVFKKGNSRQAFEKDMDTYRARFEFENIKLEYTSLILQVNFVLKKDDEMIEYKTDLFLDKNYESYFTLVSH